MKKTVLFGLILTLGIASESLAVEDTWTYKADMPTARGFTSGCVVDGEIYVIGGFPTHYSVTTAVEMYDPTADTWSRMANMPSGRCGHATCTLDGKIYVFGGTSPDGYSAAKKNVYVYDPQTDTWTQKADMPYANAFCGIAVVNDTIYLVGGTTKLFSPPISTVMAYDPVTESWTQKADMPTARSSLSACVVDGKIYTFGGADQNLLTYAYKSVEVYDPATNTWTTKTDMSTGLFGLGTCAMNGKIYAVGGVTDGLRVVTTNKLYDPVTDTWTTKSPLQVRRQTFFLGSVGNKIYAIGGSYPDSQGEPVMPSSVEEYDTGLVVTPPLPDYNIGPVANAGLPRYAALDPVLLDGTGSYDPDNSGPLSYTWRQITGPSVIIIDANTATPTIAGSMIPGEGRVPTLKPGGFTQTDEIQECEFELIVSDGELSSLPDTVKVIIVPDFGESVLRLENDSFDPDKPTFIFFGGGNCEIGHAGQYIDLPDWINRANIINFPYGYEPDPDRSTRTYYRYGDMILVYLSSVAPDYKQMIQTSGWSTGGQPAVDVGIRLNQIYADARYAVNHVTFLDAIPYCRNNYAEIIEIFLGSSVDGEQCWIDNYVSTMGNQPNFHPNILNMRTESSAHPLAPSWYVTSLSGEDMNQFNNGVIAGAYWSVVGPGKNLQLASTPGIEMYKFKWYGSESTGYMDFYDEPNHPGRLPEPVTLVGPEDGAFVDANGVVLSCEVSENAVGYQLLFGSEPYRVMDYMIVSDTPEPPSEVITTFPFEQTFWTVRVYDAFSSTIYADPVCIYPENIEAPEPNLVAYWKLDEGQGDIAYDSAGDIDATVHNGQWTEGKINGALDFNGLTTYMDCGDSLRLSTRQMTLAMWLEPQHMGGMRYVLSRAREGASDFDYVLMRHRYGEVEFAVAQEGSDPVSVMSGGTTPLNEWTHVAVCLDGSEATIYINGQLDASAGYAQRVSCEDCRLWISSLARDTRFYNGKIDDVRIYNIALSAEEIEALAQ